MDRTADFPLQRLLKTIGVLILAGGIIWYVIFQARLLLTGPELVLLSEPSPIHTERIIELEGYARNISYLSLNGRRIYTDRSGHFKEALVLENGYTVTTIEATDRYGRTATIERSFVFIPASLVTNQ